ncbi:MAG: glycerol-3-phosphate acyltransferase [Candidatus Dormibacteria bacterium]
MIGARAARPAAAGLLGYILGTLPSAAIAARLAGSTGSIGSVGTGNPGAYNAATQLGPRWGVAVGAADVLKGVLAALAGRALDGDRGVYTASTAAVAGHTYPPRRRGGKGIATSFGTCMVAFPVWVPADLAIGAAVLYLRRDAGSGDRAAPAAKACTATFLAVGTLWAWRGWPNWGGPRGRKGLFAYVLGTSLLTGSRWLRR